MRTNLFVPWSVSSVVKGGFNYRCRRDISTPTQPRDVQYNQLALSRRMKLSDDPSPSAGNGADTLMALVYDELRRSARARLRAERADHTLQPTAVVHEAYIRLKHTEKRWESETEFRRYAAPVIRRVLIDYARGRKLKTEVTLTSWDERAGAAAERPTDVLALHEALEHLAKQDSQLARLIELHYFGGLTEQETAQEAGLPLGTLKDKLKFARSWLLMELTRPPKL